MKIRCDRQGSNNCSNCRARSMSCILTPVERQSTKVKRAQFLHSIESRIERMEALLSGFTETPSIVEEPRVPEPRDSPPSIEKDLSNLIISDSGEQKYVGPSDFSLFSPRGLAWIQRKTGTTRVTVMFEKLRRFGPMWPSYRIDQLSGGGRAAGCRLPIKEAAVQLVNNYFRTFNSIFPLFDQKSFWTLFHQQYSTEPPSKRSWFGALNIVLSIGCITATDSIWTSVRDCDPSYFSNVSSVSWKLFQNASSVLLDALFHANDLMAVQTVIGMAFVMQAVMNPEGAFSLLGVAARLANALGLHRWLEGFGLSRAELEQRQRVFWILYILEKDMSSRVGRPSAIDDDDIGFGFPTEQSHGSGDVNISGAASGNANFYPLYHMCILARMEGKVYKELYAYGARVKTASERLEAISRLDAELQEWKESFPLHLRPEHPIQCDSESRFPIVLLHFGYYHCLRAVHRVNAHHELWSSEADEFRNCGSDPASSGSDALSSDGVLNVRVHASYALCLAAARSILHLSVTYLQNLSDPRNTLIWISPYFPFSAFLTLFSFMLHSPLDPKVTADQALMEATLGCIKGMLHTLDRATMSFMVDVAGELLTIAKEHVENVRTHGSQGKDKNLAMQETPADGLFAGFAQNNPDANIDLTTISNIRSFVPASSGPQQDPTPRLVPTSNELPKGLDFPGSQSATDPLYSANDGFDPSLMSDLGQFSVQQSLMDDPFFFVEDAGWDWSY
ncbi:Fungal specific transcription factor domain-containing protein [Cladophialophora immunda]|nr:Fungal specific transcription factor domain-containing protein [Cladophialophora immunda]